MDKNILLKAGLISQEVCNSISANCSDEFENYFISANKCPCCNQTSVVVQFYPEDQDMAYNPNYLCAKQNDFKGEICTSCDFKLGRLPFWKYQAKSTTCISFFDSKTEQE
jgi:hypothetical protein